MDIDEKLLDSFIDKALQEDVGEADHTSQACIDPNARNKAELLIKDVGVIAGVDLAEFVFKKLDPEAEFERKVRDGKDVKGGDIAFHIQCKTQALLKGERTVLNLMQRMSGIATLSSRFAVEVEGLPVKILDTRKTTPLLRFLEKWAVRIGGCHNYRDGLYDWIMIKDNHIDYAGGIAKAVEQTRHYLEENNLNLQIEVETRNLDEVRQALKVHPDRIMIDNFSLEDSRKAVDLIGEACEVEASGGITIETLKDVAETGVDFISSGAIIHSAKNIDLSLKAY